MVSIVSAYPQILDLAESTHGMDKHSSLFCSSNNNEEECFITLTTR